MEGGELVVQEIHMQYLHLNTMEQSTQEMNIFYSTEIYGQILFESNTPEKETLTRHNTSILMFYKLSKTVREPYTIPEHKIPKNEQKLASPKDRRYKNENDSDTRC